MAWSDLFEEARTHWAELVITLLVIAICVGLLALGAWTTVYRQRECLAKGFTAFYCGGNGQWF